MDAAPAFRTITPLSWYGIVVFWVGIGFKYMHWPGAGALSMAGCLVLLISTVIPCRKAAAIDYALRALLALAHVLLLFRFQYWAGAFVIQVVLGAVLVIAVIARAVSFFPARRAFIPVVVLVLVASGISLVPAHRLSYEFGVGSRMNRDMVPYSHMGWIHYSWFLHAAGEQDRSRTAMDSAVAAAGRCFTDQGASPELLGFYQSQREKLIKGQWDRLEWWSGQSAPAGITDDPLQADSIAGASSRTHP